MTVDARRVPQVISGKTAAHSPWEISYSRKLLYTDTLAVVGSVFGAQILWVRVHAWIVREPAIAAAAQPFATLYSIGLVTLWLGYLAFFGSRDSRALGVGFTEFRRVLQASFATFGTLAVIVYLFNLQLARGYF